LRRFILTGTPGAGKTAILRQLERDSFGVVEEAATDVIALEQARGVDEPWTRPAFIDMVVDLQRERQLRAAEMHDEVQFHDRSAICTTALADHLGYPRSAALQRELDRIDQAKIYQRQVFFIRSLGFVTPSEARRISLEQALSFETTHERVYREFGYELISIPPGSLAERVATMERAVGAIPPPRDPR
jgi:predicted ATPase